MYSTQSHEKNYENSLFTDGQTSNFLFKPYAANNAFANMEASINNLKLHDHLPSRKYSGTVRRTYRGGALFGTSRQNKIPIECLTGLTRFYMGTHFGSRGSAPLNVFKILRRYPSKGKTWSAVLWRNILTHVETFGTDVFHQGLTTILLTLSLSFGSCNLIGYAHSCPGKNFVGD